MPYQEPEQHVCVHLQPRDESNIRTDRQTGNKDKYNRQIKTISEHIFSSANLKSGAFDCQKSKVADK